MTTHILTSDVVPAHRLGDYIAADWSGVENIRAGWSVAFGPVTRVLFLQEATSAEPPAPPPACLDIALERRQREWLCQESPHRLTPPEIGVLELRIYDVRSGMRPRFLELMLGSLAVRQRHSPNFGIWSSLSGPCEQVLHLWGYRDLAERAKVREQLKADREWGDYIQTILPMLQELQSIILTPLPRI